MARHGNYKEPPERVLRVGPETAAAPARGPAAGPDSGSRHADQAPVVPQQDPRVQEEGEGDTYGSASTHRWRVGRCQEHRDVSAAPRSCQRARTERSPTGGNMYLLEQSEPNLLEDLQLSNSRLIQSKSCLIPSKQGHWKCPSQGMGETRTP